MISACQKEKVLAAWGDDDLFDEVRVEVESYLVVVFEEITDRGYDTLLGFEIFGLWEIQHFGGPIINLEPDLMHYRQILLPHYNNPLMRHNIPQLLNKLKDILKLLPNIIRKPVHIRVIRTIKKRIRIVIDQKLRDIDLNKLRWLYGQDRWLVMKAQSLDWLRGADYLRHDVDYEDELLLVKG